MRVVGVGEHDRACGELDQAGYTVARERSTTFAPAGNCSLPAGATRSIRSPRMTDDLILQDFARTCSRGSNIDWSRGSRSSCDGDGTRKRAVCATAGSAALTSSIPPISALRLRLWLSSGAIIAPIMCDLGNHRSGGLHPRPAAPLLQPGGTRPWLLSGWAGRGRRLSRG